MKLSDYDLIGYKIISPFHLAALRAYASRIHRGDKPLNVLVLVSKGPWQEKILSNKGASDSQLKLTFLDEELIHQKESVAWPLFLLLKPIASFLALITLRRRIPVCSPTMTCLKLSVASIYNTFSLIPIVIDEGIGSFNNAHIFREEAKGLVSNRAASAILSRLFQCLWSSLPIFGGSRQTLFSFDGDEPKLNEAVAASYRATFQNGYLARNEPTQIKPNTILILSQPFAEAGFCTEAELVAKLHPWVEHARRLGGQPVLKSHPAESVSKYQPLKLECLDYSGPVEELFASSGKNIKEVWSFNSTSLITGSALFGLVTKRIELPWPGTSIDFFQGHSKTLFLAYTKPAGKGYEMDT